jgi:hypothetical protein
MRRFMLKVILVAAAAALAFPAAAQTGSLQSLLDALTQGSEVTLITHFANGTSQVTSFRPPLRLPPAEAAAAVERARADLAAFGVTQPTGEQLAVALIGGTLDIPTGRTQLSGVLPQGSAGSAGAIRSQLVLTSALPQVAPGPQAGGITAAQINQAMQQLAELGIANPTPEQLQVALMGGALTTPRGAVTLPGVLAGQPGVSTGQQGAAGAGATAAPNLPAPVVPPLGPAPIVTPLPPGASPAFPSDTPGFPSSTPGFPAR